MKNTAIIIPSRLGAKRFPNKPLAKIKNLPMIVHVLNRAKESRLGRVMVATPDYKIFQIVKDNGGEAFLSKKEHLSGSDRVYEAFKNKFENNVDLVINLQGDMPNIKPNCILKLENLMRNNNCDIGTLACTLTDKKDLDSSNVVKVSTEESLKDDNFLEAKDFFRKKDDLLGQKIYHHIGIYAFTNIALTKYVKFERSRLEMDRNLEQMRAMENNLIIKVGLCNSLPLGVDTEEDLKKVSSQMN
tara:strand:- start:889 stop:1620 length:732 start_codon:yes stop_codon:yes gene_type:complete